MEGIIKKLNCEYELFVYSLKLCNKDNIIARSDEIELKKHIIQALAAAPITPDMAGRLLLEENLLDLLYRQVKMLSPTGNDINRVLEQTVKNICLRKGEPDGSREAYFQGTL